MQTAREIPLRISRPTNPPVSPLTSRRIVREQLRRSPIIGLNRINLSPISHNRTIVQSRIVHSQLSRLRTIVPLIHRRRMTIRLRPSRTTGLSRTNLNLISLSPISPNRTIVPLSHRQGTTIHLRRSPTIGLNRISRNRISLNRTIGQSQIVRNQISPLRTIVRLNHRRRMTVRQRLSPITILNRIVQRKRHKLVRLSLNSAR